MKKIAEQKSCTWLRVLSNFLLGIYAQCHLLNMSQSTINQKSPYYTQKQEYVPTIPTYIPTAPANTPTQGNAMQRYGHLLNANNKPLETTGQFVFFIVGAKPLYLSKRGLAIRKLKVTSKEFCGTLVLFNAEQLMDSNVLGRYIALPFAKIAEHNGKLGCTADLRRGFSLKDNLEEAENNMPNSDDEYEFLEQ